MAKPSTDWIYGGLLGLIIALGKLGLWVNNEIRAIRQHDNLIKLEQTTHRQGILKFINETERRLIKLEKERHRNTTHSG